MESSSPCEGVCILSEELLEALVGFKQDLFERISLQVLLGFQQRH